MDLKRIEDVVESDFFILVDTKGFPIEIWREEWHGLPGGNFIPAHAIHVPKEDKDKLYKDRGKWHWENGVSKAYVKPPELIQAEAEAAIQKSMVDAVQNHLDDVAKTKNYDGILSLCSYANSTKSKFKAEGTAGVKWRDDCWEYCYQVLEDVKAGNRTVPTPEELVLELPTINW